jgi:hypothetical protein
MDNPETLAKSGTQDTGRRPSKHKNTIQHRKQSRRLSILECFLCCIVFLCFAGLRPVSCVPDFASVSGLSILECFLCCIVITIQHRKQSRMDNPETLAKSGTQDTGRRQAKHKNTIQHRKHSRMDNQVPDFASVFGLSILDCFLCCIVFLCFDGLRPVSCVPDFASVSGLSILDRPAKHKNTIQHRKQSRMDNPETLAKSGTQDIGRRRAKHKNTIQHRKQSRMDNPETLAKSGTQDTGRRRATHKITIQQSCVLCA